MLRLRPLPLACRACALPLLLLIVIGCDEEETSCPAVSEARIVGYVLGGDGPVRAEVRATSDTEGGPIIYVTAETDSTGRYELPVPSGRFVLRALERVNYTTLYHATDGITLEKDEADSITVGSKPVRVDFIGGGITLNLRTPSATEDEGVECTLSNLAHEGQETSDDISAKNGRVTFCFPLLPPGPYAIRVGQYRGDYWLPHGDRASADTLDVVGGHTVTYAARLPAPGCILGSVTGSWMSMGLSRPVVHAFHTEETACTSEEVEETGAFALELLVPGSTRLFVDSYDGPGRWVGGVDFDHATVFDVDSAQTISDVAIVESGIQCLLEGPPEDQLNDCVATLWDTEGRIVFDAGRLWGNPVPICNLIPGAYRLRVTPIYGYQHWFEQFYDGADSLPAATPIAISADGEVAQVTLHLRVSGWIEGRVLQSDGTAALYASLFISPADDESRISLATHTFDTWVPSGAFAIPRLHTGDYKVGARIGSDPATWYPGTTDWDSAGVIHVVEGSEVSGIEWVLIE
jgi:hypothetical protein